MTLTLKFRPIATALLLGAAITSAHADESTSTDPMVGGDDRVEQAGPSGMPATTGSGGSADTKGTITDSGDTMGVGEETFFTKASAQSLGLIEAAKLALEKGSPAVQEYAQSVLDDHQQLNAKLTELAERLEIATADNPALRDQAEQLLLKMRDQDNFDQAYLENQITAHQQSIVLYQRAAVIKNQQIVTLAEKALPQLQQHMQQAQKLAEDGQITEE